ncbi:Regulator of G-protein signaling 2 [Larimichthys crocea]|uniref:Uncharacterized protein n=1 Tax=Larimichthys crocea TaxID=215358 RepID=A0ACD3RN87_LARCR|nr:Regulator of G-protein signaling 2 [Larimichthys crocea]
MASTDCMKPSDLPYREEGDEEEKLEKQNRISLEVKQFPFDTPSNEKQNVQTGKAAFCIFLKSEFCEENIEFWTACEDFKNHKSHKEMVSKANSIYEEFIKNEAPKEINLDFHTKNAIIQSLHEPTVTSFLAAQRKVYSLMENNSYPRFIHSDLYKELCDAARREGKAH